MKKKNTQRKKKSSPSQAFGAGMLTMAFAIIVLAVLSVTNMQRFAIADDTTEAVPALEVTEATASALSAIDTSAAAEQKETAPTEVSISNEKEVTTLQTVTTESVVLKKAISNEGGDTRVGKTTHTIQGTVFEDSEANGVQDPADLNLEHWKVTISGPVSTFDMSDQNGHYEFDQLPNGQYLVCEELQANWIQTIPDNTTSCKDLTNGYLVTIGNDNDGGQSPSYNFGNFGRGLINGNKFNDLNGDGVWGEDEPGLSGVTIILEGPDGFSESRVTDVLGYYSFTGYFNGRFTLNEVVPDGWVQTFPEWLGGYEMGLGSNGVQKGRDFGNYKGGQIHGAKFVDLNGNGVFDIDLGEHGMGGVTVNLEKSEGDSYSFYGSRVTNEIGRYAFYNLPGGNYRVCEKIQSGWIQTYPDPKGKDGGCHYFYLVPGADQKSYDFGNIQECRYTTTRTMGWWKKHTAFTAHIFDDFVNASSTIGDGTHSVTVTNVMASSSSSLFGSFFSRIAMTSTNTPRTDLEKARITLMHQLIPAILNCSAFGCFPEVQGMISVANNAYGSGSEAEMNVSTLQLQDFNQLGEQNPIPPPVGDPGAGTASTSLDYADIGFWDNP